jgi:dihydropteroate synthase
MVSPTSILRCRDRQLLLATPCVMGILNVTPDSFSDGGRFLRDGSPDVEAAVAASIAMVEDGATLIDVGGESTRPGATPVEETEELRRVIPIVERLVSIGTIVSVDTSKPLVACAAIDAGAHLINDVRALTDPGVLRAVAASEVAVCLMHMRGEPPTMQRAPHYENVVEEVRAYLTDRAARCGDAGISRERIAIDPGFGFGKTLEHNLTLLRRLSELADLGYPLLVGLSRKGMIGTITGRTPAARAAGGLAAAVVAVQNGARIVRTHDVAATVDALKMLSRIMEV